MGWESIVLMVLSLGIQAIKLAKENGLLGNENAVVKYSDSAAHFVSKAIEIVTNVGQGKRTDYDAMTPEQIKAWLRHPSIEEIDAMADEYLQQQSS